MVLAPDKRARQQSAAVPGRSRNRADGAGGRGAVTAGEGTSAAQGGDATSQAPTRAKRDACRR